MRFAYRTTLRRQVRFFAQHLSPSHLDVACGSGTLLALVLRQRRRHGFRQEEVIAVDESLTMVVAAAKRLHGRAYVERAAVDRLPYLDGTFQSVSMANALHCLLDPERALREIHRVLTPGGIFTCNALLVPSRDGIATRIIAWGMRRGLVVGPMRRPEVRDLLASAGLTILQESLHGHDWQIVAQR